MKSFLGKRVVIDSILNFDCHSITPKARSEVQKLLKQKATSFQHEVIHRASVAGRYVLPQTYGRLFTLILAP